METLRTVALRNGTVYRRSFAEACPAKGRHAEKRGKAPGPVPDEITRSANLFNNTAARGIKSPRRMAKPAADARCLCRHRFNYRCTRPFDCAGRKIKERKKRENEYRNEVVGRRFRFVPDQRFYEAIAFVRKVTAIIVRFAIDENVQYTVDA